MTIFNFSCFRKYLIHLVDTSKGTTSKISYSDISAALNMHRSTFSKVMNGDMELSLDSAFLLTEFLKLVGEEHAYLKLLIERAGSHLPQYQEILDEKIRQMQRRNLDTFTALDIPEQLFASEQAEFEYFSSPWPAVVHAFLGVAKYQASPSLISGVLGITAKEFARSLSCLKALKLIRSLEDGKLARTHDVLHVKKKDHLVQLQQILLRGVLNSRLSSIPLTERYGLSVSFSADEKTFEEIRQKLIAAIAEVQAKVSGAKSEKVYHLSIDMLRWEDE